MNPFKVLNIERHASNKEIIQAAAQGLRDKTYSAKQLAQAQKLLMDPISRACQTFLYFPDLEDLKEKILVQIKEAPPRHPHPADPAQLIWLSLFEKDHEE